MSKCTSRMNEMVTLHLVNAFCRPILLYGCDAVPLCKSQTDSLAHAWNRIYWKLFNTNDNNNVADIQLFMNDINMFEDIRRRRESFLRRCSSSGNNILRTLLYVQ